MRRKSKAWKAIQILGAQQLAELDARIDRLESLLLDLKLERAVVAVLKQRGDFTPTIVDEDRQSQAEPPPIEKRARSKSRADQIREYMAKHPGPVSVSYIAGQTGIPLSTVSAALATHRKTFRRVDFGVYELAISVEEAKAPLTEGAAAGHDSNGTAGMPG